MQKSLFVDSFWFVFCIYFPVIRVKNRVYLEFKILKIFVYYAKFMPKTNQPNAHYYLKVNLDIVQVGGIVITNRPDSKNAQYQTCIKQGDILLNRVQKLSRVINI